MPSPEPTLPPELQATICQLVEDGNRAVVAAMASGVGQKAYEAWITKANKGIQPYEDFAEAIGAARAQAEVDAMATQKAGDFKNGPSTAASAQFFLKTSRAKHYAEETRINIEVEGQISRFLGILRARLPEQLYVEVLTEWQSEGDHGSIGSGGASPVPSNPEPKLLRAVIDVDSEDQPPS